MTASTVESQGNAVARTVFTGLPPRYDRLAYLLSFGQDRRWRRCVVDHVVAAGPRRVLDVATGPAGGGPALSGRRPARGVGGGPHLPVLLPGRQEGCPGARGAPGRLLA